MKTIPQRDLRNNSGEILRQAEAGARFSITVDGRPVAVLGPQPRRQSVSKAELLAALASAGGGKDPSFWEDVAPLGGTVDEMKDPWEK
jgi:prevent-host-death family protein